MTVLLILLILAGLGAFVYLFTEKTPEEEQTAQTAGTAAAPTQTPPPSLSKLYEEELEKLEEENRPAPTGTPLQLPTSAPSEEEEEESAVPSPAPAATPAAAEEEQAEAELYYYYSLLDDEEKAVYDQILEGIGNRSDLFGVNTDMDADRLSQISHFVFCDHPELFWFKGAYHYTDYGDHYSMEYAYTLTQEEIDARQAEITAATEEFLAGVDEDLSDYEKIKMVYDYLCFNTVYQNSPDDQNIYSTFVSRETVCEGYARGAEYLLQQLGIPCILIEGNANDDSHAWNAVLCDGKWYGMDVTWGDMDYGMKGSVMNAPEELEANYAFLLSDDEEFYTQQGRVPDAEFFTGVLPACTDPSLRYYPSHGLFYEDTEDAWNAVQESLDGGETVFSCQFANEELRDIFLADIADRRYSDMVLKTTGAQQIHTGYCYNEEGNTIDIWYEAA